MWNRFPHFCTFLLHYFAPPINSSSNSNCFSMHTKAQHIIVLSLTSACLAIASEGVEYGYNGGSNEQTSACLAQTSTRLAQTSACLPQTSTCLPQTSTCLPQTSTRLAQTSTRLAQTSTRLPQTSTRLAQTSTRLAQTSACLAQTSTSLPQTSTRFPQTFVDKLRCDSLVQKYVLLHISNTLHFLYNLPLPDI
jgi:septal ring factor EnvC (AmiA/AmiB activator)